MTLKYVDLKFQRQNCLGLTLSQNHALSAAASQALCRAQGMRKWVSTVSALTGLVHSLVWSRWSQCSSSRDTRHAGSIGAAALILWGMGWGCLGGLHGQGGFGGQCGVCQTDKKAHRQGRRTLVSLEEWELGIQSRGWDFLFQFYLIHVCCVT